jgi:hypothetical protein
MKENDRTIRNPFFADIQRNGITIVVPIKPLPHGARSITNPYYERIKAAGGVCIGIGRPKRGEKARPTIVKSVRVPPGVWRRVERQATRERISTNAAVRQALLIWLRS